jgi:hypothetical protein
MFALAGPLIEDILAAENAVFAKHEIEAPVAYRLNGNRLPIPTPFSPGTMLDSGVTRKGGEVGREFLTDQELAVLAELVADVLSGIVNPGALQSLVGLASQPLSFLGGSPNPAAQAEGSD